MGGFLNNMSLYFLRSSPEEDISNLTNYFRKDLNNVSDSCLCFEYTIHCQTPRKTVKFAGLQAQDHTHTFIA